MEIYEKGKFQIVRIHFGKFERVAHGGAILVPCWMKIQIRKKN